MFGEVSVRRHLLFLEVIRKDDREKLVIAVREIMYFIFSYIARIMHMTVEDLARCKPGTDIGTMWEITWGCDEGLTYRSYESVKESCTNFISDCREERDIEEIAEAAIGHISACMKHMENEMMNYGKGMQSVEHLHLAFTPQAREIVSASDNMSQSTRLWYLSYVVFGVQNEMCEPPDDDPIWTTIVKQMPEIREDRRGPDVKIEALDGPTSTHVRGKT
jgi:hypothetical protein